MPEDEVIEPFDKAALDQVMYKRLAALKPLGMPEIPQKQHVLCGAGQ